MATYNDYKKADLQTELERRGIEYDADALKEDLVQLLEESDGPGAEGPTIYIMPEYNPTEEERDQDLLMGYKMALQSVVGHKRMMGNNPQYDPVIEELEEDIASLEADIAERNAPEDAEA